MDKIKIELKREEWYQVIDLLDRHASTHEKERAEKLIKKIHEAIPFYMDEEDMPF